MEIALSHHQLHCTTPKPTWKPNTTVFFFPKTLTSKPTNNYYPSPSSLRSSLDQQPSSNTKHATLLVESYHEHRRLSALLRRLQLNGSCPIQLLQEDGDWNRDHFWAVVRFLKLAKELEKILPVFDSWKDIEMSRISEFNYERIICLLSGEGMMDEAIRAFREMKDHGLKPNLEIYNSVIHGYANSGDFENALLYLNQMKEIGLSPETDTYDGLIEAYGKYKMYDEIGLCLKRMELEGCLPDHVTYNLLVREFAHGGLLKRMERVNQSMMSRGIALEPSTLVAMLEAYADFGILEKMEKTYGKVLKSKTSLNEHLVRKLAKIYIDSHMFSRLDDLGLDLYSRNCATDLVWCLRLLSHACLISRKGMDLIVKEMEKAKVSWNTSSANIVLLAYFKMKDFKNMRIILSELQSRAVKLDIITLGILFDSNMIGFDQTRVLDIWRRMGYLDKLVEFDTDHLVLTAFGKGRFLRNCEEAFCSLDPKARELKTWTYQNLINLVFEHRNRQPQ